MFPACAARHISTRLANAAAKLQVSGPMAVRHTFGFASSALQGLCHGGTCCDGENRAKHMNRFRCGTWFVARLQWFFLKPLLTIDVLVGLWTGDQFRSPFCIWRLPAMQTANCKPQRPSKLHHCSRHTNPQHQWSEFEWPPLSTHYSFYTTNTKDS